MILSFNVYVDISILNVVFECCTLAAILIMCSMYVCMFLTRCHEFPFPATRGHLPRGATFAPNRRWPLVAVTTVLIFWSSIPCVFCLYRLLKVVGCVLSMSVINGLQQKKFGWGWVGGLRPIPFFLDFWNLLQGP